MHDNNHSIKHGDLVLESNIRILVIFHPDHVQKDTTNLVLNLCKLFNIELIYLDLYCMNYISAISNQHCNYMHEVKLIAQQIIKHNYTHIIALHDDMTQKILSMLAEYLQSNLSVNTFISNKVSSLTEKNIFMRKSYYGNILTQFIADATVKIFILEYIDTLADLPMIEHCKLNDIKVKINAAYQTCIENNHNSNYCQKNQTEHNLNHTKSEEVNLAKAKIVVAGGMGLGSKENFDRYILPFAHKLGASVGASLAAIEAGFAPYSYQIGQTGTAINADLYIAIGISGAAQHLSGIFNCKKIIAINIDKNAPIFDYANYGIVGDLFEILEQLTEKM